MMGMAGGDGGFPGCRREDTRDLLRVWCYDYCRRVGKDCCCWAASAGSLMRVDEGGPRGRRRRLGACVAWCLCGRHRGGRVSTADGEEGSVLDVDVLALPCFAVLWWWWRAVRDARMLPVACGLGTSSSLCDELCSGVSPGGTCCVCKVPMYVRHHDGVVAVSAVESVGYVSPLSCHLSPLLHLPTVVIS